MAEHAPERVELLVAKRALAAPREGHDFCQAGPRHGERQRRRAAVEAFAKSGRTRGDFAKLWGCSASSLAGLQTVLASSISRCHQTSRPGSIFVGSPVRLTTSTFVTDGVSLRSKIALEVVVACVR